MTLSPVATFTRAAIALGTFLLASGCGIDDRAQLPRNIATPDTIGGAVLDLELLDPQAVECWMEVFDPQGHKLHQGDDLMSSLDSLREAGAKRMLCLFEVGSEVRSALLIHCRPNADPHGMLASLWETAVQLDGEVQPEEMALVAWQEDWWVLDQPGFWFPEYQEQEHGIALQKALSQDRSSPFRIALSPNPAHRGQIGLGPLSFFLPRELQQTLQSAHSLSFCLETRQNTPKASIDVHFDSRDDAARFAQQTTETVGNMGSNVLNFMQLGMALDSHTEPSRKTEMMTSVRKAIDQLRFQHRGSSCELTLSTDFFDAIRHMSNLQTQKPDSLAHNEPGP